MQTQGNCLNSICWGKTKLPKDSEGKAQIRKIIEFDEKGAHTLEVKNQTANMCKMKACYKLHRMLGEKKTNKTELHLPMNVYMYVCLYMQTNYMLIIFQTTLLCSTLPVSTWDSEYFSFS